MKDSAEPVPAEFLAELHARLPPERRAELEAHLTRVNEAVPSLRALAELAGVPLAISAHPVGTPPPELDLGPSACPRCGLVRNSLALLCPGCWRQVPHKLRHRWIRALQQHAQRHPSAKAILAWASLPDPVVVP